MPEDLEKWIRNADKGIQIGNAGYVLKSSKELQRMGRPDVAESVVRKALEKFASEPKLIDDLAKIVMERDPGEALKVIAWAKEKDVYLLVREAKALGLLGRKSDAIALLEKSLSAKPELAYEPDFVSKLATLYLEEGRNREATEFVERGLLTGRFANHRDIKQIAADCYIKTKRAQEVPALLEGYTDQRSLELLRRAGELLGTQPRQSFGHGPPTSLKLFISHTSRDQDLASALVELIRASLNLPAAQIRCTSVDGYRLPAGTTTEEQLKRELHEAECMIGIISEQSLRSLYVAFELGARWGTGKHLIPLLAPGTPASLLSGPLAGINALSCDSGSQLHQLVEEIGSRLGASLESRAVFQGRIDTIVAMRAHNSAAPADQKASLPGR